MRLIPVILATLGAVVPAHRVCEAQAATVADPLPDSAAARTVAAQAQTRFERLRHSHMPAAFSRSGAGCPETVGRFCHSPDEDEEWTPPPEHADVAPARDSLLMLLDSIAELIPGDGWIDGLRVHYRLEQGDSEGALEVIASCTASDWWCRGLEGHVRHQRGETEAAERAFAASLTAMPYAQRCDWNDIESMLDRALRSEYGQMRCSLRVPLHAAVWDLSDPLYIVPGNDRYTEHMSRLAVIEIMKDATTPFNMSWAPDITEIVVRFGWPVGWETNLTPGRTGVTSRGRAFSRSFIPPAGILMADSGATWDIARPLARTQYLPSYLRRIFDLDHQIAVFRRGDSVVVAAAYEVVEEMRGSVLEAALTVARPGVDRMQIYNSDARTEGSFLAMAVDSSVVASLEVYSAGDSLAARARYPVERPRIPVGGIGISDILLFRPREPLPESVEEAVFLAHYNTSVRPNEPLGLYWEVYGLASAGAGVSTEVTVIREGRGLFRGLFEAVGISRPRRPEVRYEWGDGAGDVTAVYPRAVVVDLNDTEPGSYVVRVVATPANGEPAIAERRIEVIGND